MKLNSLITGLVLSVASVAASAAAAWTETKVFNPVPLVTGSSPYSYVHNIADTEGFRPGIDTIDNFVLSILTKDDENDFRLEWAFADLPGGAADGGRGFLGLATWQVLQGDKWFTTSGYDDIEAVVQLNTSGTLDVTVRSIGVTPLNIFTGDFLLKASTLTAYGEVPEPGVLALIGLGLAGAAAARRRQIKK